MGGLFNLRVIKQYTSWNFLFSKDDPAGVLYGSLFGVVVGDGKYGVGPRTAQINPHKVDCCIDGGDFVSLNSREYSYTSN